MDCLQKVRGVCWHNCRNKGATYPLRRHRNGTCLNRRVFRRGRPSHVFQVQSGRGFGNIKTDDRPEKKGVKKLGEDVQNLLSSINVVVIGDDTKANEHFCDTLAPLLDYTPLHTSRILQQLEGKTVEEIVDEEGSDALGTAEAIALESLSLHIRCVISTCGGGSGAAARGACWRHLHGAVTVWLDVDGDATAAKAQNDAYELADVRVNVQAEDDNQITTMKVMKGLAREVLTALKTLLEGDKELCKKKALYIRLGCRGDWPNIQPPEWAPTQK